MIRALRVAFVFAAVIVFAPNVFADDSLALKWQLPQGARYSYDYAQEMTMETEGKDIPQEMGESNIAGGGPITINCNGGSATVRIETRATKMVVGGHEMTQDQMDTISQSTEMPMDADGKITQGRYSAGGNMQLLIDEFFPLPQKPLDILQSTSQDVVMFSSGGMSNLKGKAVYTFTGVKTIGDMDCIAYHVTCNLKTEKQKGKKGTDIKAMGTVSLVSDYDCLFAKDRGFFVSVDGTATVKMDVDFKDKEHPMKMSMVQHHKTSLQLKAAEYNVVASEPAPETATEAASETAGEPAGDNTEE